MECMYEIFYTLIYFYTLTHSLIIIVLVIGGSNSKWRYKIFLFFLVIDILCSCLIKRILNIFCHHFLLTNYVAGCSIYSWWYSVIVVRTED